VIACGSWIAVGFSGFSRFSGFEVRGFARFLRGVATVIRKQ
jgi:hypothetical protein